MIKRRFLFTVLCAAAVVGPAAAQGKYQVSISDAWVTEGSFPPAASTATLTVSLDRPISGDTTFIVNPSLMMATGPDAATPLIDVMAGVIPLFLTFRTGDQFKTVNVAVMADHHVEGDERILLRLSLGPIARRYAELDDDTGEVFILDDDQADVAVWKSLYDEYGYPVEGLLRTCHEYEYRGCFVNNGPGNLWGEGPLRVIDELSPLVEFIEAGPGGTYDALTHTVTWSFTFSMGSPFMPGNERCSWVRFRAREDILHGSLVVNRVCVQFPEFTYYEGHEFAPDPDPENNCYVLENEAYIPDVDFCSQFDSDRNVGPAPVIPKFWALKKQVAYLWNLGDRTEEHTASTCHAYWTPALPFDDTAYDVSLSGNENREFIKVYEPGEYSYTWLKLVTSSPSQPKEDWDNAVDGDTYWWSGTAMVKPDASGKPWALFSFTDDGVKLVNKIRMMNDTGVTPQSIPDDDCHLMVPPEDDYGYDFPDDWEELPAVDDGAGCHVRRFSVYVSTTGTQDGDFNLLLQAEKTNNRFTPCEQNDDWMEWPVPPTAAKYIKLVIDEPGCNTVQLGEFEVYEQKTLPSPALSAVEAHGRPLPDGVDPAEVLITLKDNDGKALTGRTFHDIRLFSIQKYGKPNYENECTDTDLFTSVEETSEPGVYRALMTSTKAGTKIVRAVVNGVILNDAEAAFGEEQLTSGQRPVGAANNALVFITGTPTSKREGWDNTVDGVIDGWDGTTTVRGAGDPRGPAWAIFEFADKGIYKFNYVVIQTDNGPDDDAYANRQAAKIEVLVSTTGTNPADFRSVAVIKRNTGEEKWYKLADYATAKYIKLVLLEPTGNYGGWRQIVEFAVQTEAKKGAVPASHRLELAALPSRISLEQNYPNPFNPTTTIRFSLTEETHVTLKVFDTAGHETATLIDDIKSSGEHEVQWNAVDLPSGLYFYQMTAGSFKEVKRMILVK